MAAIGAFILSSWPGPAGPGRLPARFRHPWDQALQGEVPETDAAHLEAAHVAARPPAALAAVAVADPELQLLPVRRLPGLRRHRRLLASQSRRNGIPRSVRRFLASSS